PNARMLATAANDNLKPTSVDSASGCSANIPAAANSNGPQPPLRLPSSAATTDTPPITAARTTGAPPPANAANPARAAATSTAAARRGTRSSAKNTNANCATMATLNPDTASTCDAPTPRNSATTSCGNPPVSPSSRPSTNDASGSGTG